MVDEHIVVDQKLFDRIQSGLSLCIGMACVHCPDRLEEVIELSNLLDDIWNGDDDG